MARGAGDLFERTTSGTGTQLGSKKGDFVLTIDPRVARAAEVRIVVEAKDRPMSMPGIRRELREARENRGAAGALAIFSAAHAPTGIAPFTILGDDVYCVVDPAAPDRAVIEAGVRLARLLALASLADREVDVDAVAIRAALAGIREQLEAIKTLKSQLTSIGNATKSVGAGLDTLRAAILARVTDAEAELRLATVADGQLRCRDVAVRGAAGATSMGGSGRPALPSECAYRREASGAGGGDRPCGPGVPVIVPGAGRMPKRQRYATLAASLVLIASYVAAPVGAVARRPRRAEPAEGRLDARDRYIVITRNGADPIAVADAHRRSNSVVADRTFERAVRGFSARLTAPQRAALVRDPAIVAIVPDEVVSVAAQTLPTGIGRVFATELPDRADRRR